MSQLPQGWEIKKFTDVFDINGGTQPPKSEFISEPKEGYIRLLQIRDFGAKPVPTYIPDNGKRRTCIEDDILIGRYGASVGRICTGMSGAYNVALAKVAKPDYIDTGYLKYFLKSDVFQRPLSMLSRSAQNGFNKKDLSTFDFYQPPLEDQKRIADKLDSVLAKVEAAQARLHKIPTLLKRFRQSVLAAATSGELTKDWREENNLETPSLGKIESYWKVEFSEQNRKFKPYDYQKSESRVLGWLPSKLGAICDVHVGSTPKRTEHSYWGGDVKWVSSSEVAFCEIFDTKEKITDEGLENSSTKLHPPGTVMLAMIGQGKTRGQPAILRTEASHNQNTAALRVPESYLLSEYLYYLLWERYEETRKIGGGNNQKALNKATVQGLEINLPPFEEQRIIVKRVKQLFAQAANVESQYSTAINRLGNLTQSILAKAFCGELTKSSGIKKSK